MNIFLNLFPSKSSLLLLSFFLGMLSVACEKNPSASSQVLEVSGAKLDGNGHLIANHSFTQRRLSDSKDPAAEVPSIKDALARRSDGEDVISVSLKEFSCPTGFSATSVGLKGAVMCLSEKEAQGPFSQGMQDECVKMGGGDACKNSRWSRSLAILLYGKDRCPGGGSFDANYGGCIEGNNVFGPFNHEQVARCLAASSEPNSPICMSNRWSRDFLAQLMFRL